MQFLSRFAITLALALAVVPMDAGSQVELPVIPVPVPVDLQALTTAFLVLDIQQTNCPRRPICLAQIPDIVTLLERARAAQVLVVYTGTPGAILPEVAPGEGDLFPATSGGDKFFNSDLDQILKSAGIETLLIVGTTAAMQS